MVGQPLRFLQRRPILQCNGNARTPEGVATDLREPDLLGIALHHLRGGMAAHWGIGQHPPARELAKERLFRRTLDTGRRDIGVQVLDDHVVRRHHMQLAALFMEAQLPLLAFRKIIAEGHPDHRAHPRTAKDGV